MSINRVGPSHSSPEKREREIPDEKRFKKQMTVEKVGEIDADQRKKKRERASSGEPAEGNEEPQEKAPSPFSFTAPRRPDLFGRNTPAPDPEMSYGTPQPSMIPSPPSIDDEETSRLPSSQTFWQQTQLPPQEEEERTLPQRNVRNGAPSSHSRKEKKGEFLPDPTPWKKQEMQGGQKKKEGEFPFLTQEPKGKHAAEKSKEQKKPFLIEDAAPSIPSLPPANVKKTTEPLKKTAEPSSPPLPAPPPSRMPQKLSDKEEKKPALKSKKESPSSSSLQQPLEEKTQERREKRENKGQKHRSSEQLSTFYSPISSLAADSGEKEKKQKPVKEIQPLNAAQPRPMPPEAAASAGLAASQLLPYANPEVQNLFAQMVGTVIVMTTPPGISRTQVILNSPAFTRTIFQGAEITLERYSTAPDSFNIKLTGSPQAVTVFNDNVQGLYNAFQKGRFSFRIGRIEASYEESSRPVFRRKESAGGSGTDAGGDSSKRNT